MLAAFNKASDNAHETAQAAKVANKDKISWEQKEVELMCTAVDESQIGNALVDCMLVAE